MMEQPLAQTPRFSQPRTFMRLPHTRALEGVDVAVIGVPTDDAVVFRSGARFGPEAIRSASAMVRNYNPAHQLDVFEELTGVDWGDATTVPGYAVDSIEHASREIAGVASTGTTTLCLGGDHSILLAELRALAPIHGPLGLVHFDSHNDLGDTYMGKKIFHGSVVRRAIEEGLVDPERSIQAGLRGSLLGAADAAMPSEFGVEALPYDALCELSPADFGDAVRRRVGGGPAFLTFDIDFVDPAYAPGTGTPEIGGPSSAEALRYVRSLTDIDFCGFDCVEVAPAHDATANTAQVAATMCFEMLSLLARWVREARPNQHPADGAHSG